MATSNAVLKGIKATWIDLLKPQDFGSNVRLFTQFMNSQSNEEYYYISKTTPGIKRLLDEVNFGEVGDFKLTVENYDYYNAIMEDRNRIEDSKDYMTNSIEMKLRSIAGEVNDYDDYIVCDALKRGSTEAVSQLSLEQVNCFDGKAFFSTTRNIDGTTAMNNKYTQTGVTAATFEADYEGARAQLLNFKDANGRAFNKNPNLIVLVPPTLETVAKQILNTEQTLLSSTGTLKSNIYAGDAKVVVNWAVAGTTQYRWYLINTAKQDAAILQNRQDAQWYEENDNKKKWIGFYYKFRKGVALLNPASVIRVST